MDVYNSLVIPMNTDQGGVQFEDKTDHDSIKDFIHKGSVNLKPQELVMKDLKWKYLIRSGERPKNIMMTGFLVVVKPWRQKLWSTLLIDQTSTLTWVLLKTQEPL